MTTRFGGRPPSSVRPLASVLRHANANFLEGKPSKLLGLDVGQRFVGVAVSDVRLAAALPVGTIERPQPPEGHHSGRQAASALRNLAKQHGACGLVVGWPVQLDNRPGRQCARVLQFLHLLTTVASLDLPTALWDERYSTVEALAPLKAARMSPKKLRARKDVQAAVYILQDALASDTARALSRERMQATR